MNREIYDFVAIGLGPFNLSLACLSAPLPGARALFLEKKPGFDWHPGMLIEASTLQNPSWRTWSAWPIRAASTAT